MNLDYYDLAQLNRMDLLKQIQRIKSKWKKYYNSELESIIISSELSSNPSVVKLAFRKVFCRAKLKTIDDIPWAEYVKYKKCESELITTGKFLGEQLQNLLLGRKLTLHEKDSFESILNTL